MPQSQYDENLHYDPEHCVISFVCSHVASGRLLRYVWGGLIGHGLIIIEGINTHGEYANDKIAIDFVSRECANAKNRLITYFYIIKISLGMQTNGVIRTLPRLPSFTEPVHELKGYWLNLTPHDQIKSWVVKREDVKHKILDRISDISTPKYMLRDSHDQGMHCALWTVNLLASFDQCAKEMGKVLAEFQKTRWVLMRTPKTVAKYIKAKLIGKAIPW